MGNKLTIWVRVLLYLYNHLSHFVVGTSCMYQFPQRPVILHLPDRTVSILSFLNSRSVTVAILVL